MVRAKQENAEAAASATTSKTDKEITTHESFAQNREEYRQQFHCFLDDLRRGRTC